MFHSGDCIKKYLLPALSLGLLDTGTLICIGSDTEFSLLFLDGGLAITSSDDSLFNDFKVLLDDPTVYNKNNIRT